MQAEEIRNHTVIDEETGDKVITNCFLREIAAQLAEQNQILRDNQIRFRDIHVELQPALKLIKRYMEMTGL